MENQIANCSKCGAELKPIHICFSCDIKPSLVNNASESGRSVSCEAHRPDNEELKKEYEHKFVDNTNLIGGESTFQKYTEPADIWEWISERILKVR